MTAEATTSALDPQQTAMLIAEYERSSEFCNHVDNVRNVVTSFYLTLVGAAAFVVDGYASAERVDGPLGPASGAAVVVLTLVWAIGTLFVMTIARLRRVQLERYTVMNGILDAVLVGSSRQLVPFRNSRIPGLNTTSAVMPRLTGSYFWTLLLLLPTGLAAILAVYIALRDLADFDLPVTLTAAIVVGGCSWVLSDAAYFKLSRP